MLVLLLERAESRNGNYLASIALVLRAVNNYHRSGIDEAAEFIDFFGGSRRFAWNLRQNFAATIREDWQFGPGPHARDQGDLGVATQWVYPIVGKNQAKRTAPGELKGRGD